MKIGFLITYFYPQLGGAENNCYYLARELAKKHEVHIFCSGNGDKEENLEGMKIHRCKEIFRLKYYFAFYPSLTKKLSEQKLDLLHIHGFGFLQHDFSVSKLREKNPETKIVCTPHGPFMALRRYNFFGSIFKTLYLPSIKKTARSYDAIIEVNPFQEKWMREDYGIGLDRIKFVPNGISKEAYTKVPPKEKSKVREKFRIKKQFIISYLGRVQKYKGLDQVILAISKIKKMHPDILFVIMGDDVGDKKRLEKIAERFGVRENILFTGRVSEIEKLSILDLSQIFVFPSEWEAFGIATLEAMARKNAVVSTKTEGGCYLVEDGKNGFLFDYKDTDQLFDKLKNLISNPKLLKQMQNNNCLKSKDYLWSKISLKLEKVYRELLSRKLLNKTNK